MRIEVLERLFLMCFDTRLLRSLRMTSLEDAIKISRNCPTMLGFSKCYLGCVLLGLGHDILTS